MSVEGSQPCHEAVRCADQKLCPPACQRAGNREGNVKYGATSAEPDADRTEPLARIIWTTSRADESTISATGANIVARAVLASDWLDAVRRRAGADALTEAADELDLTWNRGHDNSVHPYSHLLRERAARIGGDL